MPYQMPQIKIFYKKLQVFLLTGVEGCKRPNREENHNHSIHVVTHLLAVCLQGKHVELPRPVSFYDSEMSHTTNIETGTLSPVVSSLCLIYRGWWWLGIPGPSSLFIYSCYLLHFLLSTPPSEWGSPTPANTWPWHLKSPPIFKISTTVFLEISYFYICT